MQCSKLSSPVHLPLILVQYITPSDLSALPISGKTGTARSEKRKGKIGARIAFETRTFE